MSPASYGRFWTVNVVIGALAILAAAGLLAWQLLHPIPHWPEFDMKDAGGQWQPPERVPDAPSWVGV